MKYMIDVPDEHTDIKVFYTDADMKIIQSMMCEPYTETDREFIEDEVTGFWHTISLMTTNILEEVFGELTFWAVLNSMTYQEAKTKYDVWKKKKKEHIRVGDEVIYNSRTKAVVLIPETEERYGTILTSKFVTISVSHDDLEKTGRHFDELEELLRKIKED